MAGRDSLLKLNDKTIAIIGSFSSMTQSMLNLLSEQGADVALVGKESPEARRYVEHLNDQREIYPHFGRAGVISSDLNNPHEAADLIARVVHSYGRLDALVDTLPCEREDISLTEALAEQSLKFLTSRPRSRMMFMYHHSKLAKNLPAIEQLNSLTDRWAKEWSGKNLTVNRLVLGFSEEYLLKNYPQKPSIKLAFEEAKENFVGARLLDPSEVATWVMYLASPLSQALNGQALHLDHGFHF